MHVVDFGSGLEKASNSVTYHLLEGLAVALILVLGFACSRFWVRIRKAGNSVTYYSLEG